MDAHDEPGFLSDESEFYGIFTLLLSSDKANQLSGDSAVKHNLENRAKDFSPVEWWKNKQISPTELAESNLKSVVAVESATLYNPYEGQVCGRQLGETVEEFIQRLPPSTTAPITSMTANAEVVPWIYIANPFRKPPMAHSAHKQYELAKEGLPDENSDWAQFVTRGGYILAELSSVKNEIEKKKAGQAKASITKAVNIQKEAIVKKLLDTAVEMHCTSGKWMIFCETDEVDAIWTTVARATASNELGIAAKVATRGYDTREPRLVCIYTKDFTDMDDVARIVSKMRDLGLINMRGKPIYYKCDAYTYLGLNSGNEYNIKASLYNSADVLKARDSNTKSQKLDELLYKRK